MNVKFFQKLLRMLPAITGFVACLIATSVTAAELTAELVRTGMSYREIEAVIAAHPLGARQQVLSSPLTFSSDYKVAKLTRIDSDFEDRDGKLLQLGETLLVFKGGTLISKDLDVFRWDKLFPTTINGAPALIASEWSGGAHCCFTYHVVEMEPAPNIIQTLSLMDSAGQLVSCGQSLCLHLTDWTFADWNSPFACSISADVILTLRDDGFEFDASRMRKSTADSTTSKNRKDCAVVPSPAYTNLDSPLIWNEELLTHAQEVLTLIYSGHADKVKMRLEDRGLAARDIDVLLEELIDKLKTSQFWGDLIKMNGGSVLGYQE